MGTRPECMRYEIGPVREGEAEEPWLFVVRDACTLDCVSDANVSGVHRPGCGLEPLAPVRELRVAWQRQQVHDGLVGFCSRLIAPNPGVAVKAVSGSDPSQVVFEGRAVGYQDLPTVVVELADGAKRQWVASLVRPVAPVSVWDDDQQPAVRVCVECGVSVEALPCLEHGASTGLVTGPGDVVPMNQGTVREVPIRKRADAPDPEQVADMLYDRPEGGQR